MADPIQEIADALETFGPKQVTTDGTSVTNHSVGDIIKAAEYVKATTRAKKPYQRYRFKPPGMQS